jgi:hypothetical protein
LTENKPPSKQKIKCPICDSNFIPESFHYEKTDFDAVESKGELMKFQNEKHQLVYKPYSSFRGSWITTCPECGYILKFAAEVGKKEVVEEDSRIKKWGAFKEFGNAYKYSFEPKNKPYMDFQDYFIEKVDEVRNKIKETLDEINFNNWGQPYHDWRNDKSFDAFKFLIKFYTNLEEYCNSQVEDAKNKDMEQKIGELLLPKDLENTIQSIRNLRNKIVHEAYEITEGEEKIIDDAYSQLMYWIVAKFLKPLNLDKIKIDPKYNFIDITHVNYEIRKFLRLYLYSTLGIKNFDKKFLNPLLQDLGIWVYPQLQKEHL